MKISEMMEHISDDTVKITSNDPISDERIKEAVMKKIQSEQDCGQPRRQALASRRSHRFAAGIVAAVLCVSMLGTSALAVSAGIDVTELMGRFFAITEDGQVMQEADVGRFYMDEESAEAMEQETITDSDPADTSADGETKSIEDNNLN